MPKTPQLNGYQISVDRVIEPGQVTADRKIAVLVTAGSARLQLELEPPAALRLADGIMAALRKMTGLPALGCQLREARLRLALTQRALAALVEPPIARETLVKIEAGKRPMGTGMRHRLHAALARAAVQQETIG
jgi:DNA-binding XRE family transcriptional regulator